MFVLSCLLTQHSGEKKCVNKASAEELLSNQGKRCDGKEMDKKSAAETLNNFEAPRNMAASYLMSCVELFRRDANGCRKLRVPALDSCFCLFGYVFEVFGTLLVASLYDISVVSKRSLDNR